MSGVRARALCICVCIYTRLHISSRLRGTARRFCHPGYMREFRMPQHGTSVNLPPPAFSGCTSNSSSGGRDSSSSSSGSSGSLPLAVRFPPQCGDCRGCRSTGWFDGERRSVNGHPRYYGEYCNAVVTMLVVIVQISVLRKAKIHDATREFVTSRRAHWDFHSHDCIVPVRISDEMKNTRNNRLQPNGNRFHQILIDWIHTAHFIRGMFWEYH